jgi:hypothetical protein
MWKPERWTRYADSLLAKGLASQIKSKDVTEELIEDVLEKSYTDSLY